MNIYEYKLGERHFDERGVVIALGFFDGVHRAHRKLLSVARAEAARIGLPFKVFTFRSETFLAKNSTRLYSTDEKMRILASLGCDEVILAELPVIMNVGAEEFVRKTLLFELGMKVAVCGFDFRFGKGGTGDGALLTELAEASGARTVIISEETDGGEKISTARIKRLMAEGKIGEANALLCAPYRVRAVVETGLGMGTKMGVPTVNIPLSEESCPLPRGVYRSAAVIDGTLYAAITNVGKCPTFGERELHAETNIIGFTGVVYGREAIIYFLEYLREEKTFKSKKELLMQINVDKNYVISKGVPTWQEIGQS